MPGKKVCVIGGGAAGFFAAIQCARTNPDAIVTILEKSSKLLSKVRISGGGRCNVTNAQTDPALLSANYPRGGRELLGPFHRFGSAETWQWFSDEGVRLKREDDGRVFPVTDDSGTIINCLLSAAKASGVTVRSNASVTELVPREEGGFSLTVNDENTFADAVIVASGGSPQLKGFDWLKSTGHQIVPPVPSLFTFNIRNKNLTDLMGVSVDNAIVRLKGSSLVTEGPVLITHWGLSGPAVLRLSSIGARYLNELNYRCEVSVGWYGADQAEVASVLNDQKALRPKARVTGHPVMRLPLRLWEYLCAGSGIEERMTWSDLSKKHIAGLSERMTSDRYMISGKTTFREEFVTCGGISLREVDFKTMESKLCKGLYFAGEILDIDGITGGFNFQAAWTTGYIAGSSVL